MNSQSPRSDGLSPRKALYVVLVIAGGFISLALLLNEGRNTPVFLLILYIGWVLSPFMGLLLARSVSHRWTAMTRTALFWIMTAIVVVSLSAYTGLLTAPETRPAAIFLMVPLFSWTLMAIAIISIELVSRRKA